MRWRFIAFNGDAQGLPSAQVGRLRGFNSHYVRFEFTESTPQVVVFSGHVRCTDNQIGTRYHHYQCCGNRRHLSWKRFTK